MGEHEAQPLAYHELTNSMIQLTVRWFYMLWREDRQLLQQHKQFSHRLDYREYS